ncbi:MAG TPA: aminotransferase class V-fold PLP-dependent enzyme [Woeseiaceae bacterium]|jgi:glutamate/tyrosine decarboxylase-like PLP-dependent enzyme|nr:aminotransferase class V-fold PLP-dependent enzyme [Woeseiaceae bacterium]
MINKQELELLANALDILDAGAADLPDFSPQIDKRALAPVLAEVAQRMQDNYPYFHPQYAGQMLKPPHPVARIAYALSLWVNPNNHALDGSRASSPMEKECIVDLGRIFGWDAPLGHLTSGGTMANLEALWVAGRLHPGKKIVASAMTHYTHSRISDVLRLPFAEIDVDERGRMDPASCEKLLANGDVGTVVVTMGTTGLGVVDPLPAILELRKKYDFRIHADAAYGGYFGLTSEINADTKAALQAMSQVDSIVIDPHKHGLQPYGCGCVLFRDHAVGTLYKHDSPYTYFSSGDLHLGEITLECSRPGAAAVALWATHQLLPPVPGGAFADGLDASLRAARTMWHNLDASSAYTPLCAPELDIVVYAVNAASASESSRRARDVFDAAAKQELHLALIELPVEFVRHYVPALEADADVVTCLRSVLMKPEHEDWVEWITATLEAIAA